jgi:arylsulfatase A-like enzyme
MSYTRCRWLSGALLPLLLLATPGFAQEKKKRPNVLFLFTDDQRADTIAALGNTHIKTPNLDKLVLRGTAFTRAYCMGAMQGAVCVPSRAMMLSGRSLFRINDALKGITTWPAMFARLGYRTFITGKWHNQEASALAAFSEGRAVFFGGMGAPYTLPVADITPTHTLTEKRPSGKHSVALFADSVIDFLKEQKGAKQPFLAYVAFNGPHDPREAPKEYHDPYNANKPPLPANFLPLHPFNNGDMTGRDEKLAPWPRTPEVVRQHLADYYAYITFLDAQIGRILAELRAAGLEEDTIVVFSSDSGLAVGSHGLFGKQNLYDHSMRSPLIFAGPGIPAGKQSTALCYLYDIYPTLGELTGVKGPEGSEGKSLVPVMKGETKQVRDALFLAYRGVQRSVRDERWQLITYPQINKTQLFDLQNDPHETKDLSGDPAQAKQVERLTEKLKELQKEYDDKQPLRSDKPLPEKFDVPKKGGAVKKKVRKEAARIETGATPAANGPRLDSLMGRIPDLYSLGYCGGDLPTRLMTRG